MHIVMVAGEASGDILGAGLMQSLKALDPSIQFSGIGGPRMLAMGFNSLFPIDRLSVMGLVEPLKRLPELLHIRKTIKRYCTEHAIDIFIGIDSPDFNLPIERFLKSHGVKTVHYVSPSVWAWRQGRIHKIRQSVDLMLTLFPFEAAFYEKNQVPVKFIGHTLADDIPLDPDTANARAQLGVSGKGPVIALLPGSRSGEVDMLGRLFLDVATRLQEKIGRCEFILPAANDQRRAQIAGLLSGYPDLNVMLLDGKSHLAMEAADAVLLASGTTALEAMLLKKPMVVAYKMAPLSYAIISRMVKTPYVSLPNLLANRMLVPELLQDQATIETLSAAILKTLYDNESRHEQVNEFYRLHNALRCNASAAAAKVILELV